MRIKFLSLLARPFLCLHWAICTPLNTCLCVRMQSCREDPRLSVSVSVCDYICVCVQSCKGTARFLRRHDFLFFSPHKKIDTKGWILSVRTSEHIHSWLWTNINNLWTHMQIWWHSHRNTQCSSATQQTKRCEISNSNHLGFQQLSSDERAKTVSRNPMQPSFSFPGWWDNWYSIPYMCLYKIYICLLLNAPALRPLHSNQDYPSCAELRFLCIPTRVVFVIDHMHEDGGSLKTLPRHLVMEIIGVAKFSCCRTRCKRMQKKPQGRH